MLLIITNQQDVTTDMLMPFFEDLGVLRFDIDRWPQYKWQVTADSFRLEGPDGRVVTDRDLHAVYLRKAMFPEGPGKDEQTRWCSGEVERLFEDLYHRFNEQNLLALIHPGHGRWYKVRQMKLAEKWFEVPRWSMSRGVTPGDGADRQWVVKTHTQDVVADQKNLFVRKVDPQSLEPAYPWFLQETVEADEDVTVVYIEGQVFAYALDRSAFTGVDYRPVGIYVDLPWTPTTLTTQEKDGMRCFMEATGYSFGRFDFLRKDKTLFFLEMNPNGQWAWLEKPEVQGGLFSAVVGAIRRKHEENRAAGALAGDCKAQSVAL